MAVTARILISLMLTLFLILSPLLPEEKERVRLEDLNLKVGTLPRGRFNAITDVAGVKVGHYTLIKGDDIRTGVTAIIPHSGNLYQEKVPAAIYVFNAYGKLAGYTQVEELGNIETPIILTNTLAVGTASTALVRYTLAQEGNENVVSVNAVVGETNDGYLNNIRKLPIKEEHIFEAIKNAHGGKVEEGCVGAGTGTVALGFKGGIGTSSRIIEYDDGKRYTVGVLVQTNFGRELHIAGHKFSSNLYKKEERSKGSCMIVIATDAPMSVRNLKRLAKRAFAGMARTTNVMSNGSGDYAIAFSTAYRIPHYPNGYVEIPPLIPNSRMTQFFQAVEEATQEAIYNSIMMAESMKGYKNRYVAAFPIDSLKAKINCLQEQRR